MAEYIEREAALHEIGTLPLSWEYGRGIEDCYDAIAKLPLADVLPVVHGRWIRKENGVVKCSECGCMTSIVFSGDAYDEVKTENNFCYNCGAKMDLEV